ncbi:leucine-rich repeat-containing protein 71 isoform X2 [Hypanus sabinus]|uniref:leucine-rich repeat-containing protein 71 isoform X2 n=1 Tax=Hypanus sabinus TaxID=79690 RepID=UPI0028C4872B|nr:leucine-rich repeat-containing protein 71 isoform X2 [Hypanus sabinus]
MGKKVEKVAKEKVVTSVEEEGPRNPEDYVCTGNLEVDFTELCNRMEILEFPLVVPRHPAVPLGGLADEMQSLSASDKSTPSSAAVGKEHISFFRPCVQVEMESDDPKLVKAIYIRAWMIDQRYIFIFQKCLPALVALQTVSLWNVGLTEATFTALVAILRQCTSLKIQHLTLRNNQIDDVGAKLIGEALSTPRKCNKTLLTLNLNFNHITDKGIGYIAEGLRLNRSLLWLSVAYNQIGDEGAIKLAKVLSPFALTHEEIVERRLLQSNSQESPRSSSLRRPESKSDRSSQIESSTAIDKSQKSAKSAIKKKDKKEMTFLEKATPSITQVIPKKDDFKMLKRGSIAAELKLSKTKMTRSAKEKRNVWAEQETQGIQNPLLEPGEHQDGQVFLAGNICLMSLNLSHNHITEVGVKALLAALKVQISQARPAVDGRSVSGLLRLVLTKNAFPVTCEAYTSLQELIVARDPMSKHHVVCSPPSTHGESQLQG